MSRRRGSEAEVAPPAGPGLSVRLEEGVQDMYRRTLGLLAAVWLTGGGLAEAGGTTLANARIVDPATGATITTRGGAPGTASFEIATNRLTIHKDVLLGRSVTTISAGGDRLAITIDRTSV